MHGLFIIAMVKSAFYMRYVGWLVYDSYGVSQLFRRAMLDGLFDSYGVSLLFRRC